VTSIRVETAMVLVVEAPQRLLLCRFTLLTQFAADTQTTPSRVCPMTNNTIPVHSIAWLREKRVLSRLLKQPSVHCNQWPRLEYNARAN
jgi:hypothetical protein